MALVLLCLASSTVVMIVVARVPVKGTYLARGTVKFTHCEISRVCLLYTSDAADE